MDRRQQLRFARDEEVLVTVLTPCRDRPFTARVSNISGRGMQLRVPQPLSTAVGLQIAWRAGIALGEVSYCQAAEDHYLVGIQLQHTLQNLAELAGLRQEWSATPPCGAQWAWAGSPGKGAA